MLRFPTSRQALESRYQADAEFRSLCADYEDAHTALKAREQASSTITRELSDYRHLVVEIEADVQELLSGSSACEAQHPAKLLPAGWRAILKSLLG
jgi:hypothetical protein